MKEADRIKYERDIAEARKHWDQGPWTNEPDRVEWRHRGLPCLMLRSTTTGAWCGYVGVPNGHPLYGSTGDELSAHGGITLAAKCHGAICHIPQRGETDDVFWFGFDCAHAWDDAPMHHDIRLGSLLGCKLPKLALSVGIRYEYRDLNWVKLEVERLADQIAEHGPTPPLARLIEWGDK